MQATCRDKNNFKEAEDLVTVQYEFSEKAKDIPPSERSRTYPSIKKELKRKFDEDKTPKRATHEVLMEKGGIAKTTYGAEVPTINQVYKISRKRSKSSQNPFKTLIDKQQKDGFTSDNITQIIQTNPFSYDIQSGTFFLKFFIHPQSESLEYQKCVSNKVLSFDHF